MLGLKIFVIPYGLLDIGQCVLYAHSGGYLKIITEHFETSDYSNIMFVCIFVDFKTFGYEKTNVCTLPPLLNVYFKTFENKKIMFARFLLCSIYTLKHLEIRK